MPTNQLTILPVKLDPLPTEISSIHSFQQTTGPSCVIKTTAGEISFFNGVDDHIIQVVMKQDFTRVQNIYIVWGKQTCVKELTG